MEFIKQPKMENVGESKMRTRLIKIKFIIFSYIDIYLLFNQKNKKKYVSYFNILNQFI